ncbi:MAG: MFS transporter [Bacteroidetes bacterium]|nr:MAG: MFS transporter [Bacteroidota bacterium]
MRIITRTIVILSLVSLLADVASEMIYPVIPLYLNEIGFNVFWIGMLEAVANFTAGISKGYFGKLSDEKGVRLPFVKLGYLLSAISKPIIVLFTAKLWVFFARTVDRLGKGVRTAARDALLSQEATKENKAKVFGFHRSMDTLGAAIGPIIALVFLLYSPGNYQSLFFIAFVPGILAVLLIFLLKEKKHPSSTLSKGNFFSYFSYWKIATPAFKKLVPGLLLFALFNSSDFFLLLKTKEALGEQTLTIFNITFESETITILAYIFYNLIFALAAYPLGILADKWGMKKIFMIGLMLFAIVYAGFAFNPSLNIIFLLFFLYGIYAAATEGIAKAWITNTAHESNTATAVGFYTSCESICAFAASAMAGAVWAGFGSIVTFLATSFIALIVLLYFLLKFKRL